MRDSLCSKKMMQLIGMAVTHNVYTWWSFSVFLFGRVKGPENSSVFMSTLEFWFQKVLKSQSSTSLSCLFLVDLGFPFQSDSIDTSHVRYCHFSLSEADKFQKSKHQKIDTAWQNQKNRKKDKTTIIHFSP